MATHSSTLAWKIPWTEEPGRLQSMGLLRVGHDWATSLSLFTFIYWRRNWQPTPVFLPGESQGQRSLMGCHLRGRTELDTTEATQQQQQQSVRTVCVWDPCEAVLLALWDNQELCRLLYLSCSWKSHKRGLNFWLVKVSVVWIFYYSQVKLIL